MNPQTHSNDPASLPRPIDPGVTPQATSQPVPQGMPTQGSNKSTHSPEIAEDVDLIEKEWVEKAKHIVSQTKDNPSEQNIEISKLKADYMKKRYNKDIEIDVE